jgi:predicted hydrocarbon binding protein
MENVFAEKRDHGVFSWTDLSNIKEGRGSLGEEMPVLVYRLMQYTLVDVLTREFGREKANHYIREAGRLAGKEFTKNVLNRDVDFDTFIANLQKTLIDLKIGILRIESVNENTGEIVLTVAEDLDCSGLPITGESVCDYDEGFISGILDSYTGKSYSVREIDCWASGDRVCRFQCKVTG